jgi:hypothetical protein
MRARYPARVLLLAAVERASRHLGTRLPELSAAVPVCLVAEHLGVARGGHPRRGLRPKLEALAEDGLLEARGPRRRRTWRVTKEGSRLIARYPEVATVLPESPQHRAWREARDLADKEFEALRAGARSALIETDELVERGPDALELMRALERLRAFVEGLAGACYCLFEWEEPHDDGADIDPRIGVSALRNLRYHLMACPSQQAVMEKHRTSACEDGGPC